MKKTILFLLIFASFLKAEINERVTDIYFGNGVWNDYFEAIDSMEDLQEEILRDIYNKDVDKFKINHYSDRGSEQLNRNIILLSFNWTGSSKYDYLTDDSRIIDLIETFYQLKDNNQMEGHSLYEVLKAWLTQDPATPLSSTLWDKIDDIVGNYSRTIEGSNLVEMIEDYEEISLRRSHKVLLIAHSQGNLFGNEVYDNLIPWEKNYFKMVSVGTPADNVLGVTAPYTTLKCDKIISSNILGGIPNHLPAFTDCTEGQSDDGHQFVDSYLFNHISQSEIMGNISISLGLLKNTKSQWLINDEYNEDTCEHKVSVKHIEDASIVMDEAVYLFSEAGKLYKVGEEWVKASYDGEEIKSEWEGQGKEQCYLLSGTNETIETPPLEQGEINATITSENIDPNKKIFISLTRTDYPHTELIDTVEVDTNQSVFWHLFDGLEYGRYDSLVYSVEESVIYDLEQVILTEESPRENMVHSVDMNYFEQSATFTEEMIRNTTWIISNTQNQEEPFEVTFDDSGNVNNIYNDDVGFSDGDTWQITPHGDLNIVYYFFGIPLTTITHKITNSEGSCFKIDSSMLNSNWHGEYLMCQ